MFERYTERARRVVFFARYEASQFGSFTIESEHLLLGLTREDKNITNRFLRDGSSAERIRQDIESRSTIREKASTSIDLPLSLECKRILAYAAEEAQLFNHLHIGTEHVLLGILREEQCVAAQILQAHGLRLELVRGELKKTMRTDPGPLGGPRRMLVSALRSRFRPSPFPFLHNPVLPETGVAPDAETAIGIAETIWKPLYGVEAIESQKPFQAELLHGMVWLVTGSAKEGAESLSAFILKADGRVLAIGQAATKATAEHDEAPSPPADAAPSQTDALTGVYDRRMLHEVLTREVSRAERYKTPLAILKLDVDDLKRVNDVYGHTVGDQTLKSLAQFLRNSIRRDDFVFRCGGDEFCVVAPVTRLQGALRVAQHLRVRVEAAKLVPGLDAKITISIGVAEHEPLQARLVKDPSVQDPVNALIEKADSALYKAKRAGGNRIEPSSS